MKKLTALILVFCLVLTLAACGGEEAEPTPGAAVGAAAPVSDMHDYMTSKVFLENSLMTFIPSAIDWAAGTCDFDNADFVRILEAAKEFYDPNAPEENFTMYNEAREMFARDEIMLWLAMPGSFVTYAGPFRTYGSDISYVGWPTPDGECGSWFIYSNQIGVCARTEHAEGCWEFIRFMLGFRRNDSFSTLRSPMEKSAEYYVGDFYAKHSVEPGEDGAYIDGEYVIGFRYDTEQKPLVTQGELDKLYTLIDSVTICASRQWSVSDIVFDESAAYFAGDRTAEETAQRIQSRVSLYVAEQAG